MNLIQLSSVSAYRGDTRVFQDLSLAIRRGESTAILGPNGAGKSTLLKLLTREIYPASGEVRLLDQSRWNVWELRKHLGLVSADLQHRYQPHAAGRSVVMSGFYASNDVQRNQEFGEAMRDDVQRVMEDLGIADLAERPFGRLSTGQQRRFLLARALVHRPETLVLDEPTAGLDVQAQFQYFATMRRLMQQGTQLVLVTHHVNEILPEIREIILLKEGRVLAAGPKDRVLKDDRMSQLFDCPVRVLSRDGYFHLVPG